MYKHEDRQIAIKENLTITSYKIYHNLHIMFH